MIYGNKFLEVSCENNISLLNIDYDNYLNWSNKCLNEIRLDAAIDLALDTIFDKIEELFKKFIDSVNNLINFFRLKLVKLRDKIISSLDAKINGKFTYSDDNIPSVEDVDDIFDNGTGYREINEASSDKQFGYIYYVVLSKFKLFSINEQVEELLNFTNKYGDALIAWFKDQNNSTKDELNKIEEEYDNLYQNKVLALCSSIRKQDDLVSKALKELKENKGKQFKNDYFEVEAVDVTNKESLKEIREIIVQGSRDTEKVLKDLMDNQKATINFKRKVEAIKNKYDRIKNSTGKKEIFGKDETNIDNMFTCILTPCTNQYKYLAAMVKSIMYANKMNYKFAIKQVKHWGNKEDIKENK